MLSNQSIWNPWRELEALSRSATSLAAGRRWNMDWANDGPAFNIYSGDAGVLLTAELPGFDPESLDVTAERDLVTIRGQRDDDQTEGVREHARERHGIAFEKSFRLPFAVDGEKTEAVYEKGVLTVRVNRPEEQKPQKIGVRTV